MFNRSKSDHCDVEKIKINVKKKNVGKSKERKE